VTSSTTTPFDMAEIGGRRERAQAELRARGLACALLFDPENIFYLTGYQSIGYFTFQALLLPGTGLPLLISRRVNQYLARQTPALGGFVPIPDTADPVEVTAQALRAAVAGPDEGRLGVEKAAWYLTALDFERLSETVPGEVENWSGVVEGQRLIKSPAELDRTARAARAAEAGMAAAIEAVAPGATENDVAAAMHAASIRAGSEYPGHAPLVAAGERSGTCFATWRRRPLADGEVVFLETVGCVDRYHAMLARAVVVGGSRPHHRDAAAVLVEALDAAIDAIRPGASSAAVDEACRGVVERAGYGEDFVHRTGYSVGIGFPPNWSEGKSLALRPGDPTVLEPGMTFHIVPTIFKDEFGMCFSETVRVTANGCEVITRFPRRLFESGAKQ